VYYFPKRISTTRGQPHRDFLSIFVVTPSPVAHLVLLICVIYQLLCHGKIEKTVEMGGRKRDMTLWSRKSVREAEKKRWEEKIGKGERREKRAMDAKRCFASHRSSSEKQRKGAFLRRVAVEANRGLYSDRPCSALFHPLVLSEH